MIVDDRGALAPPQAELTTDHLPIIASAVHDSELVRRAIRVAADAHTAPGHGGKEFGHPVAVADLVASRGYDEVVVAAAVLHDTVEDTPLTIEEIRSGFGEEVAGLVAGVTEDPDIHPYAIRKAEARTRMMRDRRTAAIYAADKLASVRELLAGGGQIDGERLEHFNRTLRVLSEERPDLPFLSELAAALAVLIRREMAGGPFVDRGLATARTSHSRGEHRQKHSE